VPLVRMDMKGLGESEGHVPPKLSKASAGAIRSNSAGRRRRPDAGNDPLRGSRDVHHTSGFQRKSKVTTIGRRMVKYEKWRALGSEERRYRPIKDKYCR
jgi:hypothetical protein